MKMNSRLRIYKILQAIQNASYTTPKGEPIKINPDAKQYKFFADDDVVEIR